MKDKDEQKHRKKNGRARYEETPEKKTEQKHTRYSVGNNGGTTVLVLSSCYNQQKKEKEKKKGPCSCVLFALLLVQPRRSYRYCTYLQSTYLYTCIYQHYFETVLHPPPRPRLAQDQHKAPTRTHNPPEKYTWPSKTSTPPLPPHSPTYSPPQTPPQPTWRIL